MAASGEQWPKLTLDIVERHVIRTRLLPAKLSQGVHLAVELFPTIEWANPPVVLVSIDMSPVDFDREFQQDRFDRREQIELR